MHTEIGLRAGTIYGLMVLGGNDFFFIKLMSSIFTE